MYMVLLENLGWVNSLKCTMAAMAMVAVQCSTHGRYRVTQARMMSLINLNGIVKAAAT